MFVALVIQHAKGMRRVILSSWPLWLYRMFLHYLINGTIFERKKKLLNIKCVFDFLYNFCLKHFSFEEEFSEIKVHPRTGHEGPEGA